MPSRYGRGIGLQIAGRGIQGFGAQLPGIIAGAREEDEDPLVRKKLELDVAAGEQKIAKGLREEDVAKSNKAKEEQQRKDLAKLKELIQKPSMQDALAKLGEEYQKQQGMLGKMGGLVDQPALEQKGEELQTGVSQMQQAAPTRREETFGRVQTEAPELRVSQAPEVQSYFQEELKREEREGTQAQRFAEKQASQEFKTEERLAGEEFKKTEKEKDRQLRRSLDALKQSNSEGEGKKYERKSTTTAAKMTSDLGFALGKLQNLRSIVETGDADILNTSILGEFTDPTLKDAILQLTEFHGREQSGAAISNSEWNNFKKQILNRKFLLTEAGRKTALANLDDFVGRYFAKGEAIANSPTWFDEYEASKKRGIEKIGGKKTRDFGKEYGF